MSRVLRRSSSRWTATTSSLVLHAAFLATMACIQVDAAPLHPDVEVEVRRFDVALAPRKQPSDEVVAVPSVTAAARIPEQAAEIVRLPDNSTISVDRVDLPSLAPPATTIDPPTRRARAEDFRRRLGLPTRQHRGAGTGGGEGAGVLGVGGGGGGGGSGGEPGGQSGDAGVGVLFGGSRDGGDPSSGRPTPPAVTRPATALGTLAAPVYPAKARARGWEGRVLLAVTIDEHGRVVAAEVVERSGHACLDDSARDVAFEWTFSPALRDGRPVADTMRVPVRFELTD